MAFRSRKENGAWRARRAGHGISGPQGLAAPSPPDTRGPRLVASEDQADIELRRSPLFGAIVLIAGLAFCVLAVLPQNTGGRNFRLFCGATGVGGIAGGVVLLRRRPVVARLSARALHLPASVVPWTEIDDVRRARSNRSFWIGIYLKNRRRDLDEISRRTRAMLVVLGSPLADADCVIRESDLPRSGLWFLEECRRRMGR